MECGELAPAFPRRSLPQPKTRRPSPSEIEGLPLSGHIKARRLARFLSFPLLAPTVEGRRAERRRFTLLAVTMMRAEYGAGGRQGKTSVVPKRMQRQCGFRRRGIGFRRENMASNSRYSSAAIENAHRRLDEIGDAFNPGMIAENFKLFTPLHKPGPFPDDGASIVLRQGTTSVVSKAARDSALPLAQVHPPAVSPNLFRVRAPPCPLLPFTGTASWHAIRTPNACEYPGMICGSRTYSP